MTYELCIPIRDYASRQSMQSDNFFEKQICDVGRIAGLMTRNEMCHLRKPVHHHKDGINSSLCSRQSQNKIHANCLPWPLGYRQWLIEPCVLLSALRMLTYPAPVNKSLHLLACLANNTIRSAWRMFCHVQNDLLILRCVFPSPNSPSWSNLECTADCL
jgi:hypothetical protein